MNRNLSEEFKSFLDADPIKPSAAVTERVLDLVGSELNPSFGNVFVRVLGVHAILSLLTLSICSQFGIQVFPLFDLMTTFMSFVGHTYCMAFCGALYVGSSALSLSLILNPEQVGALRKNSLLQLPIVSFLSLALFLILGAEISMAAALFWLTGALISGIGMLELGWFVRIHFFRTRLVV